MKNRVNIRDNDEVKAELETIRELVKKASPPTINMGDEKQEALYFAYHRLGDLISEYQ